MSLEQALGVAAETAGAVAKSTSAPISTIATVAEIALKAAVGFARNGSDPVVEIERVLSSESAVRDVHDEWDDLIDRRFGRKTDPPPRLEDRPPDTDRAPEPYDEEDEP